MSLIGRFARVIIQNRAVSRISVELNARHPSMWSLPDGLISQVFLRATQKLNLRCAI